MNKLGVPATTKETKVKEWLTVPVRTKLPRQVQEAARKNNGWITWRL
jgi:hypothetical protein